MIVTILGSSAKQTDIRECVSLLIDVNDITILFDAGPGIVSSFNRAHRNLIDVDTLILTHVHGDHILGFSYFVYNRVVEYNQKKELYGDKPLKVIGKKETIDFAKNMLRVAYEGMKIPFDISYVIVESSDEINLNDTTSLKFIDAIHAVPTLSTIITANGKKIVYTSDTLPNEALIEPALNAELLIHEAMYTNDNYSKSRKSKHATGVDAGNIANRIHANQLVLVHIAPNLFGNEKKLLSEIAMEYNGVVSIPFDGTVYYVNT